MLFLEAEVSPVALQNSHLVRQLVLLPIAPIYLFEDPLLAQVRGDNGMLMLPVCGYELVEEPEQLVNLLPGEIRVVAGVLDFERVDLRVPARHDVWERAQAGVADRYAHGVAAALLQELDQNVFAVEASLTPASKRDLVDFLDHFHLSRGSVLFLSGVIR